MRSRLDRHLLRDDSILDVPASSTVWIIFALTVVCAIGLSIMLALDIAYWLAVLLIIPIGAHVQLPVGPPKGALAVHLI